MNDKKYYWKMNGYFYEVTKDQYNDFRNEHNRHKVLEVAEKEATVLSFDVDKKPNLSTHYYLDCDAVSQPSVVLFEQITTIDKRQIKKFMGSISHIQMEEIGEYIEKSLGLNIPEETEFP